MKKLKGTRRKFVLWYRVNMLGGWVGGSSIDMSNNDGGLESAINL
jgi:hypothetical protein